MPSRKDKLLEMQEAALVILNTNLHSMDDKKALEAAKIILELLAIDNMEQGLRNALEFIGKNLT